MDKDKIPENWRTWSRPPEDMALPILRSGASMKDDSDPTPTWTTSEDVEEEPESNEEPRTEEAPSPVPNAALEAIRAILETSSIPYARGGVGTFPDEIPAKVNATDPTSPEWFTDPSLRPSPGQQPEITFMFEEAGQVADWLASAVNPSTEIQGRWTTCLRHVTFEGQVCVCLRAADHEEEGDESFHLDHNAKVMWTDPDNVWRLPLERRGLDSLSVVMGIVLGMVLAMVLAVTGGFLFL